MVADNTLEERGGGRVSYREGFRVQEGDLGRVEVDIAGGLCRVEFGPHELWQVCRHRYTPHVASSFVWPTSLLDESLCWCWELETQLACDVGIIPAGTPDDIIAQAGGLWRWKIWDIRITHPPAPFFLSRVCILLMGTGIAAFYHRKDTGRHLYAWQPNEATYGGHKSRHKVDGVESRKGDQKTGKL